MRGAPMKSLLEFAFRETGNSRQTWIEGSPDWAAPDRFDVFAKAPPDDCIGGYDMFEALKRDLGLNLRRRKPTED